MSEEISDLQERVIYVRENIELEQLLFKEESEYPIPWLILVLIGVCLLAQFDDAFTPFSGTDLLRGGLFLEVPHLS